MSSCRFPVLLAIVSLGATSFAESQSATWPVDRKKVVSFGWEWKTLTAADYVKYADRIDRTGLDGVGVYVFAEDVNGHLYDSCFVSDGTDNWTKDLVRGQIADFRRATAHRGLRESFIRTMSAPHKRLDWADDAVWGRIARNMGVLAWLAKADQRSPPPRALSIGSSA